MIKKYCIIFIWLTLIKNEWEIKLNIPFDVFEKALDKACITFACVSKRNTGKTFMTRQLIRHLAPKYFSNICVFILAQIHESVIDNSSHPEVKEKKQE